MIFDPLFSPEGYEILTVLKDNFMQHIPDLSLTFWKSYLLSVQYHFKQMSNYVTCQNFLFPIH